MAIEADPDLFRAVPAVRSMGRATPADRRAAVADQAGPMAIKVLRRRMAIGMAPGSVRAALVGMPSARTADDSMGRCTAPIPK